MLAGPRPTPSRMPSVTSLVGDMWCALMERSGDELAVPDTGALRSDLVALAMAIVAQLVQPRVVALIRTLVAEGPRLPAFRETARAFWTARFERTAGVVQRAIDRGDLPPGTDIPMVLESLIAPLYLRLLVTGGELSEEFVVRVVDLLLDGVLADSYPMSRPSGDLSPTSQM